MSGMTDETDVYICGICKKDFQDFVAFLRHKSSFGVFKCKLCNLSYHDREDIQNHINQNHSNQKVDVAFTISNRPNIVSTKTTEPEPNEVPKSGYALSVFTCRLCNRFTLVEKNMLQHLENVHKIHVVPRSVELAALMLCSKPLDSATVPKLLSNPVLVKTVTPPTPAKPTPTTQSLGTQTVLCTANVIETSMGDIDTSPEKQPEFFGNWALFAEMLGSDCEGLGELVAEEVAIADDGSVKMESILKSNILGLANESRESNVCIDGGHDYVSVVETKEQMIIEEQAPATLVLTGDIEEFSTTYEPSTQDASISLVEHIINDEPVVDKKTAKASNSAAKEPRRVFVVAKPIKMELNDDLDEDDYGQDETVEEPQPGLDGMYHCRSCKRAFARERQFKAHMSVHAIYGEHVMDSPSSNRSPTANETKSLPRKRQKTQPR